MKKFFSVIIFIVLIITSVSLFACDNNQSLNNQQREVEVTKITLSVNSVKVEVGKTCKIDATVFPENATNKTITWSSSNSSVADYSNGKIISFSAGTTIIKAKSKNGIEASCIVTVENAKIYVSSVTFDTDQIYIAKGQETTLVVNATPKVLDDYTASVSCDKSLIVSANYSNDKTFTLTLKGLNEGETNLTLKFINNVKGTIKVIVQDLDKTVSVICNDTLPKTVSYKYYRSYEGTYYKYASVSINSFNVEKYYKNNEIYFKMQIEYKMTYSESKNSSKLGYLVFSIYNNGKKVVNKEISYYGFVGDVFQYVYEYKCSAGENYSVSFTDSIT